MTFLTDDEQRGGLLPQQAPEAQAPSQTWTELFKASAESSSIGSLAESTALSWQRSLPDTNRLDDPSYDPFNDISGYEQFADAFARSGSRYETDLIKRSIDRRLQNQDTVARGGLAGLATTIATEPLMFVPMGGAASITSRIANPFLRMGAAGAITGFGGAALVEGALQATDPTRTLEQSAANIALSTGFGTGIGTVAAGLSKFLGARTGRVGTDLDSYVRAAEHAFTRSDAIAEGPSTTGAMATRSTTMEQESLKSGLGADYLNKLNESEVIVGNPLARTRASDSLIVRQLSGELAETPFITKGNTVGIASPQAVETQIKRWQAPLAQALQDLDNQFTLYRLGRERRFGDVARIGAQDTYKQATRQQIENLTYSQFKEEVARLMRRGDGVDNENANPFVAAAAQSMRRNVFDPLKERAIEAGLLPEDVSVETALSYLTRVYDKPRIIKQRNVFEQRISDWLLNIQQEIKQQIEAGKPISDQNNIIGNIAKDAAQQAPEQPLARVEKPAGASTVPTGNAAGNGAGAAERAAQPAAEPAQQVSQKPTAQAVKPEYVEFSKLDESDLRSIAQEITDKIIGSAPGRSNYEPIPLTRGPLRERTLSIPDAQIEDFLENDIERVARIYTRTMSTDVELATKFGRADMADQLVKVQDSYAVLRSAAEKELGQGQELEKRLAQLDKAMKRDIQDLEGMRDRIRGTYAIPDDPNSIIVRTGRAARTLNYVRLLGGMTLSAIPDVANPILHHGFGRVFGTLGAIKNLELYKLAANEVKLAGTALDMVLDSRAMQMADIWDDYGKHTTFERGLQAVQDRFGVVSLMAPWNATMKQFAGVMGQTRVLQEVKNWTAGSIGAREMERLAQLGIDKPMAERIAQQAEHWKADEGVIWANTGAWTDREAVDAFRNAIVKEVDAVIVTPGQDRPLWMSTEMGKMVGQFRSFAFTALNKVSVSALQRADKNVMQGIVSAVALGMMVHALKQAQYGRPMPEKPQDWIVAGLDRSGVMGWLFDANNMIEKATAGTVGINPLLGTSKTNNRFAARNVTGSLAGPSFGLLQDMIDVTAAASSGQFDRTQLEKVRRMIPYQNVPYLAWMFDQMEEGAGNAMGLPAKRN